MICNYEFLPDSLLCLTVYLQLMKSEYQILHTYYNINYHCFVSLLFFILPKSYRIRNRKFRRGSKSLQGPQLQIFKKLKESVDISRARANSMYAFDFCKPLNFFLNLPLIS